MFKSLLPRDDFFFGQFERMCDKILEGVEVLHNMVEAGTDYTAYAEKLKNIENENDAIVHDVVARLHKTFVTPIDREDIFHLVGRLDDILDLAEGASSRIALYQPKQVPQEARDLSQVLLDSTRVVREMVGLLRHMKKSAQILELTKKVHFYEHQGDMIRRGTLARLFREEKDVLELIKWKDIQEYIEKGTDRCEDVANITEGIVLENT
jgi:uncharacterized protein